MVRRISKPNVTKFKMSERAVLVECLGLKQCWCEQSTLCLDNISFSSNLDITGNKKIGLQFELSYLSPALKTGITVAICKASGKLPVEETLVKNKAN